jgi:myosin protein heavy chain
MAQTCCCSAVTVIGAQAVAEQIAQERDAAEREAREKETRVLSQTREIDEMNEKVEELERGRRQLQAELDELVNSQGTADKNVSMKCLKLLTGESGVVVGLG